MSQIFNGSSGGGLTSVATDATLTGDGTSGDPLSVVATGGTYSVSKTVFSNGALPPVVAPASVFPDAGTWFTPTITSTDVDYATGDIRFLNAGTYRITMQLSFEKVPDPAQHDVQINFGLTDAPPNAPLYENITFQHFDSNGFGVFTCEFTTVLEATAGQTLQVAYVFGGTVGSTINYFVGAEAGFIIVERVE